MEIRREALDALVEIPAVKVVDLFLHDALAIEQLLHGGIVHRLGEPV